MLSSCNINFNNTRTKEIEDILSDYKVQEVNLSNYEINKIIKKYKDRLANFNFIEHTNINLNDNLKMYNLINKKLSGKYKVIEINKNKDYILTINRNKTLKYYLNQNVFFKEIITSNKKDIKKDIIKDLAKYLNINC